MSNEQNDNGSAVGGSPSNGGLGRVMMETSERLMDGWYLDGKRLPKYHAQITGEPGYWGCGRTPEEAVLSVMRAHNERFPLGRESVDVAYLGILSR